MIFVHLDSTKTNNKQGGTQGFWKALDSDSEKDQFWLLVEMEQNLSVCVNIIWLIDWKMINYAFMSNTGLHMKNMGLLILLL